MPGYRNPGSLGATPSKPIDSGTLNRQRTPEPKPVGSYGPAVLTHRWVDAATYHRTFLTTEAYANRNHIDVMADISLEADRGYLSPYRAAWIKAYEVDVNARSFAPTFMMKKPDQDFAKYATPFEQAYSDLVKYHDVDIPPSVPVVVRNGDDYLVVGYVVEVQGDDLFVPKGVSITVYNSSQLGEVLEKGVPFFIAKKEGPLWKRAGISEASYSVLARVDGGVIRFLASRATGFVESEFGPILFIATAFAPLGQGLVRSITNSIFRQESGVILTDLALDGMTDELAQSGEEDLREIARKLVAQQPPGRVVVNLGGTGEVSGAINVNPLLDQQVVGVPSLVRASAEQVGEIFPAASVDSVVSNNVVSGQVNWTAAARGSYQILRPGGSISIAPYAGQLKVQLGTIKAALQAAGFQITTPETVKSFIITAIK
jgi:hypothetical protein